MRSWATRRRWRASTGRWRSKPRRGCWRPSTCCPAWKRCCTIPPTGFFVVAESGGEVAGALLVTYEWSDWRNARFWWIQSVYVRPEHRRRGIYRELHEFVRARARAAGGVAGFRLYVERENVDAQRNLRRAWHERDRLSHVRRAAALVPEQRGLVQDDEALLVTRGFPPPASTGTGIHEPGSGHAGRGSGFAPRWGGARRESGPSAASRTVRAPRGANGVCALKP